MPGSHGSDELAVEIANPPGPPLHLAARKHARLLLLPTRASVPSPHRKNRANGFRTAFSNLRRPAFRPRELQMLHGRTTSADGPERSALVGGRAAAVSCPPTGRAATGPGTPVTRLLAPFPSGRVGDHAGRITPRTTRRFPRNAWTKAAPVKGPRLETPRPSPDLARRKSGAGGGSPPGQGSRPTSSRSPELVRSRGPRPSPGFGGRPSSCSRSPPRSAAPSSFAVEQVRPSRRESACRGLRADEDRRPPPSRPRSCACVKAVARPWSVPAPLEVYSPRGPLASSSFARRAFADVQRFSARLRGGPPPINVAFAKEAIGPPAR